ncbi:MAG: ADP-ribosylglycohydrolase family protein, partial [Polyangiaceae bacterium]
RDFVTKNEDHLARLQRARASLEGLSVGDAFGERFFVHPSVVEQLVDQHALPAAPWTYTDDTVMALSIVDVLSEKSLVDQDLLAALFASRYRHDPRRGYGGTAHDILTQISEGVPWKEASYAAFDGSGSMGNGGAMRVAPVGAYFFDDFDAVVENARRSAEVTHAHLEGQAGAIAVAVAAACVSRLMRDPREIFDTVLSFTPDSETRAGILQASVLPLDYDVRTAVSALGNGTRVISQDTVPFSLWCAARHPDDFEAAMWCTVSGLGDRDTTCAIVGGIIAARPDVRAPHTWVEARERLENMSRDKLSARRG